MKRLFRKDNRIARLVALWLVFIMALTPLYEHSGFKNPTKAASGTAQFTLSVDLADYVTKDASDNTVTVTGTGDATVASVTGDSTVYSMKYWNCGYSGVKIKGSVTGFLAYGDNSSVEYDTVAKVYTSGTPTETLTDLTGTVTLSDAVAMNNNDIYAIYVKVKEFKYDNGITTVVATNNQYHLLAAYKLEVSYESDEVQWVDGNGTDISGVAQSAALPKQGVVTGKNKYLGTYTYSYAKKQLNTSNIVDYTGDYAPISITPGTLVQGIDRDTGSAESKGDGYYIGFIQYNDDLGNGSIKRAYISFDNTAQVLRDGWPIWLENGYYPYDRVDVRGKTDTTYLDISGNKNYNLSIYTVEENAVELDLIFYEGENQVYKTKIGTQSNNSGYQTYVATGILPDETKLPRNKVYDVKVALVDSVGNDGGEHTLMTICPIDKTFKVENVKYYEVDSEGNETEITNIKGLTNNQQRVKFTVTSGDKLGRAEVYGVKLDSTNSTLDSADLTGVAMYNGLYKVDVTLDVPKDTSVETTLNAIKLYVTEDGANSPDSDTRDLAGNYKLDLTKPSIEPVGFFEKESWKDGNNLQNWVQLSEGNGYSDSTYKIDYDLNRDFRYVYQISDANGIAKVEGYLTPDYSDTPVLLTHDTTNGEQYYYMQYSTAEVKNHIQSNGALKLYIKVYDNAGNVEEEGAEPYIIEKNNDITIDSVYLQYEDGEPIDFNEVKNINKAHDVVIKASSGEYITEVILQYKLNGEIKTKPCTVAQDDQTIDPDSKRKVAIVKIPLPEDDSIDTAELTEMKLIVHDTRTDVTTGEPKAEGNLYDLLYDSTKPTITVTQADGTSFVEDNAWIKLENESEGYVVDAVVTPGPGAYESKITSANYKTENSVNNKEANGALDYEHTTGQANGAHMQVAMFESLTAEGTKVIFNATDKAGNQLESGEPATPGVVIRKRIDGTAPSVRNMKVNGNENNYTPLGSTVNVTATAVDSLSLDKVYIRIENLDTGAIYKPEQDFAYGANDALNESSTEVTRDVSYQVSLPDGTYKATVQVVDKAGWESGIESRYFVVDGTAPELTAVISAGTKGNTNYHYRSDVTVSFICKEEHVPTITVKDNGEVVSSSQVTWTTNAETGLKEGTYVVNTDGQHTVTIEASDATGNVAIPKSVEFIRDTQPPTVTSYMNGLPYSNTGATRVNTSNTTIQFAESESVYEFYYSATKSVPDETSVVGSYDTTAYRDFVYSEEAVYKIQVYAIDMAGNVGEVTTVDFRIDKTAPNISIGGITSGGTSSSAVTLSLNMNELYWNDASGTVEIYMKSGEGFGEELIEEINYTPTGRNSVITRNLSESGIYRVEFNAQDSAGHTSTASSTFTIDTEVPVVTLEGVSNYDVTDQDVTISSTITEKFYASKTVTVTGTVTDETGKVTPITIDDYSPTANPTVINKTFSADGIYDLTITCVDVVGNSDSKSVHFIIDKSDPVIGDLSDLDGKILTSFVWDEDLDELVSDLTVCDVHMYLNGQEYNGEDAVEDGSYVLLITAEDELGHKVEKSAQFVLDTKAPVFIVTGVEDEDKKIEPYNITVSLQLEEDTLTKVTLNDKVITITNNMATFNVTEVGEYKLYMEAVDEAGNVSSAEYEFELAAEKEFNFWIIIGIAAALLLIILFIILKKRKKDE